MQRFIDPTFVGYQERSGLDCGSIASENSDSLSFAHNRRLVASPGSTCSRNARSPGDVIVIDLGAAGQSNPSTLRTGCAVILCKKGPTGSSANPLFNQQQGITATSGIVKTLNQNSLVLIPDFVPTLALLQIRVIGRRENCRRRHWGNVQGEKDCNAEPHECHSLSDSFSIVLGGEWPCIRESRNTSYCIESRNTSNMRKLIFSPRYRQTQFGVTAEFVECHLTHALRHRDIHQKAIRTRMLTPVECDSANRSKTDGRIPRTTRCGI